MPCRDRIKTGDLSLTVIDPAFDLVRDPKLIEAWPDLSANGDGGHGESAPVRRCHLQRQWGGRRLGGCDLCGA